MVFEKTLNFLFGWAINLSSPWNIIVISFILTLIVDLSMKFLSDQKAMKFLKEESENIRKEIVKFKHDPQKMMELQKKQVESSMKYMRHSLTPTAFTLLPLLVIFNWLRNNPALSGETLINLPFAIPLIGSGLGWLGTYIISSIIFNIILRKLLKLH